MPDPTPGEVAYAAYAAVMVPLAPWGTPDFAQLPDIHQRAWEAAAQAVLTQALAQRVWERQTPSSRWQEVPPAAADVAPPTVLDLYEAMGEVQETPPRQEEPPHG